MQGAFRFECYAYPGHYLAFFPPTHLRVGCLSLWLHHASCGWDLRIDHHFVSPPEKIAAWFQGVTKGHTWNERRSFPSGLAVWFMNLWTSFFLFVGSLCFFPPSSPVLMFEKTEVVGGTVEEKTAIDFMRLGTFPLECTNPWEFVGVTRILHMGVSKNNGTPKSSISIGFSIINHPFWRFSPYFWKHPHVARIKDLWHLFSKRGNFFPCKTVGQAFLRQKYSWYQVSGFKN